MVENDKVKLTAVVVGTTIFFAYFNQFIYYDYFNIDISNYLDIQDVLTPFMDELTMIVMLFAFAGIGVYTELIKTKERTVLTIAQINRGIAYCVLTNIILIGFIIYLIYTNVNYIYWLMLIPLVILIIVFILLFVNHDIIQRMRTEKEAEYKNLNLITTYIIVVLTCSSVILLKLSLEISNKKDKYLVNTYKFKLKDKEEIITSDSVIYLGRTKNHFFIYKKVDKKAFPNKYSFELDSTNHQVDIYNTSEIIKEEFLLNKPF